MPFDFMNKSMIFDDDTRFVKLCESIEDAIRDADDGEEKYSDLEVMQAINVVGFSFFRDDWEEFKKMDSSRESDFEGLEKTGSKKIVN